MCRNVNDAILNSNVTSLFTLILPWLAAKSHLEHGFTNDSIFGERRSNAFELRQETPAPVSKMASNGISQI